MTEFFESNPRALRHLILFEVLRGNSIHQTYSKICSVIGKEVVDYKIFELLLNHYPEGFIYEEEEKSIVEALSNDKYALRVCILYEFLRYQSAKLGGSIFNIFVNFCKVIGVEDVLKYPEFEFWFCRFLNGNYDLNYEKKSVELMDMPIDTMEKIVEYLDIFDRARLAKTSRSLQTFVENQKQFQNDLKLSVINDETRMLFREPPGSRKSFRKSEKSGRGVHHWKHELLDLRRIFKNPKLYLDTLNIDLTVHNPFFRHVESPVFDDLEHALKSTDHLKVKNLRLVQNSGDRLLRILPYLKPGYLTKIDIRAWYTNMDSMEKVFRMEQWKQAKCFVLDGFFIWPLHHLYHFEEFTAAIKELSMEDVRQMREILFKSPDFKKCTLKLRRGVNKIIFEREFGNSIPEEPYIYHYPIPNSTDYFEINVRGRIEITRKKE